MSDVQSTPGQKNPAAFGTPKDNAQSTSNIISRLLLLTIIIMVVAYSSKFILGLSHSKEYLSSAFERLFDEPQYIHEGVIEWQVIYAIGAMLLQMLVCAALCSNFHSRVQALATNTGTKIWYLATGAILLILSWPFITFAFSLEDAYQSVKENLTDPNTGKIDPTVDLELQNARLNYIGSVVSTGIIAILSFFAHLRWPKLSRIFALLLCAIVIAIASWFHVESSYLNDTDLFRWVGAFTLVFIGGAFVWSLVYLWWSTPVPDWFKLCFLGVIAAMLVVKASEIDPVPYAPHEKSALLKTNPCSPEAIAFARFERSVFEQLDLKDEVKFDELGECGIAPQQTFNIDLESTPNYYQQQKRSRTLSAKFDQLRRDRKLTTVGERYEANAERFFNVPSLQKKFVSWIRDRREAILDTPEGEKYTIYIATAQGGGLYAAYHAALGLARLQDECPHFGRQLFAISSVSGGAVGAQLFSDLVHHDVRRVSETDTATSSTGRCKAIDSDGPYSTAVKHFFFTDYQASLIGTLMYTDVPMLLLPRWLTSTNRALALDRAFASGWDQMWRRLPAFGISFNEPSKSGTSSRYFYKDDAVRSNQAPTTIVNAAVANNGMPLILSPFYFSSFYNTLEEDNDEGYFRFAHFFDVVPGLDVPLTTAVLLGARFPYVTPGGRLPIDLKIRKNLYQSNDIALADGGYFDNTGTATALALARRMKLALSRVPAEIREKINFELVRMVDKNRAAFMTVQDSPHEALLPLATIYSTRLFKRDLFRRLIKAAYSRTFDITFNHEEVGAPLSWQLSRRTRKLIEAQFDEESFRQFRDRLNN